MDEIEEILEACEQAAEFDDATAGPRTPRKPTFTPWERSFLESIREWYDEHGSLTERQEDKLHQLWDKT